MLTIKDIRKSYSTEHNTLPVLKGISMQVNKGEMVSVMGSSGSGKTTLLNILGILDHYDSGEYFLNNLLIHNLDEKIACKYRNKYIGFVFQSFNLIPYKNALENIALPLYYKKIREKERNRIAMKLLDRVGLRDWWHHLPNELSGGQKQRVAIARALVTNPSLILADEPTGALDSVTSLDLMKLLKEINKENHISIIIVTHDLEIAYHTDRIIRLKDGIIEV